MSTPWRLGRTLLLAFLLAACQRESDPTAAALSFFEAIRSGKTAEAYKSAAFGFQAQQTERVFLQTAREMGLAEAASATVLSTERSGNTARLTVEIVGRSGGKAQLVATLQRDGGEWRVYSLRSPRSMETGISENRFSLVGKGAGFSDVLSQPMPEEKALQQMIKATMTKFAEAVHQQNFADFYNHVSAAWQTQLTERQLQRAFQPFIDQKIDLSDLEKTAPVYDIPPQITTDGLLLIAATYPTQPYKTQIALKFIYELPEWKLFGIDVNLRK